MRLGKIQTHDVAGIPAMVVDHAEMHVVAPVERISAEVPSEPTNERYLQTKREKMGHLVS